MKMMHGNGSLAAALLGQRAGQHGLAGPWGAVQQHAWAA